MLDATHQVTTGLQSTFIVYELAQAGYKKGERKACSYTFVNVKETRHQWQQCGPRISYRPAPAGNLWYSSLTSSCFALPLSTLCLRISAISMHHSSNLELSRSTSSWRKAVQNRKAKKNNNFILFSDTEWYWLRFWWQLPTVASLSARDLQPEGRRKTEDGHWNAVPSPASPGHHLPTGTIKWLRNATSKSLVPQTTEQY